MFAILQPKQMHISLCKIDAKQSRCLQAISLYSLLASPTIHRFRFQRRLFVFWCVSCVAAVAIVYVNSWRIKHAIGTAKRQGDGTQVDGSSGGGDLDGGEIERRKMSIVARKQFHILMLFVFLPGLVFHKEMLTLASSCALGLFLVAEVGGSWNSVA